MADSSQSLNFFFNDSDLDETTTVGLVEDALQGMDDGELYLESTQSESFTFDDGRLKGASFDSSQGFGLRAVLDEGSGYAHSNELSHEAIKRASNTVRSIKTGGAGSMSVAPARTNRQLYAPDNPLTGVDFDKKVALLEEIDAYTRAQDDRIRQVSASILGSWQSVEIIRADGHRVRDVRPLVRLNVSVVMGEGDRQEMGYDGQGGRQSYDFLFDESAWQSQVQEAIRQAEVNLQSIDAPAGEMTVVLGPGWPGVLLHEAVGHGLEGDFNRKKNVRLCRFTWGTSGSKRHNRCRRWNSGSKARITLC